MNDECGMMNDELKTAAFSFIVHHSAFIIPRSSFLSLVQPPDVFPDRVAQVGDAPQVAGGPGRELHVERAGVLLEKRVGDKTPDQISEHEDGGLQAYLVKSLLVPVHPLLARFVGK